MLIESYDNNNFGTIIYSENKFDFLTNFTRINRNEPEIHELIDFKEVSAYISKPVKKNLILYRLLTNDENLDPFSTKLGFFVKLKNKIEVVYFDPIFIIKDIDNLRLTIPKSEFKYIIQQVGYRTKALTEDTAIYEESFSIEMSEEEAENQNDSVFAESMLSLNGSAKKKNLNYNSEADINTFRNIASELNKLDKQFKSQNNEDIKKNKTFNEENIKAEILKEENDFFTRVMNNKERKNYKNNTLKLFK
ncbi:MAG: hypothetical protein KKF62_02045 [Bacteroidetes bacterium]|nr:hypothetical protein [Bacteroidota bacterium]MBU1799665.1 hypothetical protein [Bacteroidota bacterium]